MKRLIPAFLCILMCVSALVGCGSGGNGTSSAATTTTTTTASPSPSPTAATSLTVYPPIASVIKGGVLNFLVRGATGTASFLLTTNNSGAYVTASGTYTAGSTDHTFDVMKITDTAGHAVYVTVLIDPTLKLAPPAQVVGVNQTVNLDAAGGSGSGYIYTLYSTPSYGAVSNGVYESGPYTDTVDIVTCVDSASNSDFSLFAVKPTVSIANPRGNLTVAPGGTLQLTGSGGTGSYTFLMSSNLSGGSLNEATGLYKAGAQGGVTDVVIMGDSGGSFSVQPITVTP